MADGHGGARQGAGRPKGAQSSRSRFQIARAKKEESLAELRALELERRKRELIPRAAVVTTWQGVFMVVRNRLLALPSKIAGEAAMLPAPEVAAIVAREVRQALTELANSDGLPPEEQQAA
jgi:hypothetical protein